jgi:hypothetical protein
LSCPSTRSSSRYSPVTVPARLIGLPAPPRMAAWAMLSVALTWVVSAPAQDAVVPEPLGLDQALAFADAHPRVHSDAADAVSPPRRLPLYLACHDLAFGASATGDDPRNRPVDVLLDPADAQRLEILERFLDVLLADQSFSRYSEAMAVAYIQFDRASVRRELGQVSDLRVAELNATYQEVRQRRAGSEAAQRLTRALLAQAMDRPDALPRELTTPRLPALPDPPPGLEEVVAAAEAGNRALAALKGAKNPAGARVLELELRQQALELLMRLQALAASLDSSLAEMALRDLKLDESRVLYEQEAAADLGYSMSQQTKAKLDEQRVGYCRILAWAELQALQGRPVWPLTEKGESP